MVPYQITDNGCGMRHEEIAKMFHAPYIYRDIYHKAKSHRKIKMKQYIISKLYLNEIKCVPKPDHGQRVRDAAPKDPQDVLQILNPDSQNIYAVLRLCYVGAQTAKSTLRLTKNVVSFNRFKYNNRIRSRITGAGFRTGRSPRCSPHSKP